MTKSEHLKISALIAWSSASKLRSQQPEIVALRKIIMNFSQSKNNEFFQNKSPLENWFQQTFFSKFFLEAVLVMIININLWKMQMKF